MLNEMTTLIKADDTLSLWAIVISIVCLANWLDQKFKWANKLSVVVMCIISGFILGNLHVVPFESSTYDAISGPLVKLAIPMLLLKSDVKKIVKGGGRIFGAFHIASLASMISGVIMGLVLMNFNLPNLAGLIAMETAGAIGGTVNMVAMAQVYAVDESVLSAGASVGNFLLGIMLMIMGFLCSSKWVRGRMSHPYIDAREAELAKDPSAKGRSLSAAYWKNKELSLLDLLKTCATVFSIVALSGIISTYVKSLNPPFIIKQLFGSIYLVMTTLTVLGATLIPKWFEKLKFGNEIGTIFFAMWFVTVGLGANIKNVLTYGLVFVFDFSMFVVCHLFIAFPLAKLFKISLEEACCATMASYGGPSSSSALVINQGWNVLIAPTIVCALWGYAIGNYLGILIGNLFL